MNNLEPKKREYWVDVAKGMGILFVMLGHTPIGSSILKYTYIFNMPGFLFLSGYFFKLTKFKNFEDFFRSKAKAILIPYAGLSIISIVFYIFYYHMPWNDFVTIKNMIIVFFTAIRNQIFYNIPLWFLPTLFFIENIFYLIRKLNKKYLELVLILILGGYGVMKWDTLYNPRFVWTADTGLFFLIFFATGYYLKNRVFNIRITNKYILNLLAIIAILINSLILYSPAWFTKIFKNNFVITYKLIYFLSLLILAFSGIYVITTIAKLLKRQKLLEFLGKNSLAFFGLHVLCFWILDKILKPRLIFENHIILLSILYVIITTAAIVLILPYLKKHLPLVFGRT